MPTNNHSDNFNEDQAPLDDEQLWDMLSLYVDGEADPEQAAIVEQMLNSDPAYRRDFDFLMASSKTMHAFEEVEPPTGLFEAIQAKTTHRPTLVGRLRAAWNRVTVPAYGRYATIGGAFAAAALAIVFLLPHLRSNHGTAPISNVVRNNVPAPPVVAPNPPIHIPDIVLPPMMTENNPAPRPPNRITPPVAPPSNRPNVASDTRRSGDKGGVNAPIAKHGPQNHPLQARSDPKNQVQPTPGSTALTSYAYDPKMDLDKVHRESATIGGTKEDFGSKVDETASTPTVVPPSSVQQITQTGVDDYTHQTAGIDKPTPAKSRIYVATLPPDVSQNLKAESLRSKHSLQIDSSNRSLEEAGPRPGMIKVASLNL